MHYFKDPLNPSPNMYDNARIIANSQLNERRVDPNEFKGKSLGAILKNSRNLDIFLVDPLEFDSNGFPTGRPRFAPDVPEGEGYWDKTPDYFGGPKGRWHWVSGKRPYIPMGKIKLDPSGMGKINALNREKIDFPKVEKGAQNNQTDGETDEDIIRMRQTAADQGGIPQDMVNEPIRRTKQTPDGKLIYGESHPKPKVRPNIGGAGPMIPKKLPPSHKNSLNKAIFGIDPPSSGEPQISDYDNILPTVPDYLEHIIRTVENDPTRMSLTKSKSGFYIQ